MPRPTAKIEIPMRTLKGILDMKEEGKSDSEIAEYFGVSQPTITRRIQQHNSETPQ